MAGKEKAVGSDVEISGQQLWQARKHLGLSRGHVGRMLHLPDKTVGAIERKDLPIPDAARANAALFMKLAGSDNGRAWRPKAREPKVKLPFARPTCPDCKLQLVVKSAHHRSPQRGTYFYFRCPQCKQRFWSNDGVTHRAKVGRGNWKNLSDRPTCPDCHQVCWFDGRASRTHKKRIWACPRCKKRYVNAAGQPNEITLPKHLKRVPFLPSRTCPKCHSNRLRLRTRPPNAPYWYFRCPDCEVGFRWNGKLKRLVVAKGPSKERRVGRAPGMTKARKATAQWLLKLQARFGEQSGSRGALKKAVAVVFPAGNAAANYVTANKILCDYRKQSHS